MPSQSIRFTRQNLKFTGQLSDDRLLFASLSPVSFFAKQGIPRVSILASPKKENKNILAPTGTRTFHFVIISLLRGGGGGVLPYKRLMGMCRWMGSHFHHLIDYNGVTFLVELLEWGRSFSGFLG